MPFLRNWPLSQIRRRIFTHDGSNDADSRKDVFLGICSHGSPFRGSNPQIPQFLGVNRHFQAKLKKVEKRPYYQNDSIDSNQILHSAKDHQVPFVGSPNTHITNPRWRTAAILKNSKNRHTSAAVWAISTKYGTMTQFDALNRSDRYKLEI